jgi:acyl-coenzyme A thioesterase PaaI-like protein
MSGASVAPRTTDEGFEGLVGPLRALGPHALELVIESRHLNPYGRLHGGMVMTMLVSACARTALVEARRAGEEAGATLLSLDCQFIGAAELGMAVRTEVSVVRVTRTMAFLSARMAGDGQVLASAAATYRIGLVEPPPPAPPDATPDPVREGWPPLVLSGGFSRHVAPLFERVGEDGVRRGALWVDATRTDALGRGVLHEGMALYAADIFCGRAAHRAVGSRAVTLGMQLRRYTDVAVGAWVTFVPQVRQVAGPVAFVDGTFTVNGRACLGVSSLWKVIGAR